MTETGRLRGDRHVIGRGDGWYPPSLLDLADPPDRLHAVGDPAALAMPSIAVVGARKCTPYGRACARRFAALAAERGFCVVSGGARGIDGEAHRAAMEAGGTTVAVLGGGCDQPYPPEHAGLFQEIVGHGGVVVSEREWDERPMPYAFRQRNRIVAALAGAVLVVEAGLPSGTLSAAVGALALGRDVWAVPGHVTALQSRGPNSLLLQGARPIVDDRSFLDALASLG